jgi:hypothetical protein
MLFLPFLYFFNYDLPLIPSQHSTMSDLEKPSSSENYVERTMTQDSNDARIYEFSEAEQKSIIRRIDRRLVATLGILYCASLMDRTNLGNAAIAG